MTVKNQDSIFTSTLLPVKVFAPSITLVRSTFPLAVNERVKGDMKLVW